MTSPKLSLLPSLRYALKAEQILDFEILNNNPYTPHVYS